METEYVERSRVKVRDPDGGIHDVIEYQIVTRVVIDSSVKTTKGGVVYRLLDGRDVHLVDESTFRFPDTEKILTRI